MAVEVYLDGLLEPVTIQEPIDATAKNMSAAVGQGIHYFMAKNDDNETVMFNVLRVIYLKEIDG